MRYHPANVNAQFVRFIAVGGAFAFAYSFVVAVLVGPIGLMPYPTSIMVFAFCVPAAFLTHKRISFSVKMVRKGGFIIYATSQIASCALVLSLTTQFVTGTVLYDICLYLASVAMTAIITFIVAKFLVFQI
jgi:putative flippase GtrA